MRPRLAAAAALAAALLAASSANAADKGDDLDVLLSNKPAAGQPIDAAGSGVRQGGRDHGPKNGGSQPTDASGGDPGAGGLADPTMSGKRLVDETVTNVDSAKILAQGKPAAVTTPPPNDKKKGETGVAVPAELQTLKWTVFDHLGALSAAFGRVNSFGKAPLTPGTGISVAFMTPDDPGNGQGGHCALVETPGVPMAHYRCSHSTWISQTPGGPAVGKNCIKALQGEDSSVTPYGVGPGGKLPSSEWNICGLEPHARYYCNVAGCPGAVASGMGAADYTPQELAGMSADYEGRQCKMPGTASTWGTWHNGVCTMSDGSTTAPADTRPRCSMEVMREGSGCVSCESRTTAACSGSVKLVADCDSACRP